MKLFVVVIFVLLILLKRYKCLSNKKNRCSYFINRDTYFLKKRKCKRKILKCKVDGIEYKVNDLDKSINFYTNVLNFKVNKKEKDNAQLILGDDGAYIKLIQKGEGNLAIGEHSFLGLGVHLKNFDINKTKLYEGKIDEEIDKRPVTPCILPDEDAQIRRFWTNCFITDPDGYGIEVVLQNESDKLDRIRFFTTSTKDAQKFYSDILGMQLVKIQSHLEEISYPWNIYGGMSYYFSSENNSTILQMAYAYDEEELHMGNSLGNLILCSKNLNLIEKKLNENNIEVIKNDKGEILVKDLDGYHVYLKDK
ncbi:glyoxalase I [Plasmodium gaboni]|uniref:Glyoxalase I n=1 Tax=Plasmodium gaboni TaxID=647221 RepID=A0ABY1UK10_9APIC|nr:glyoxalase I [Plasmodium gaboni]